MSVVVKDAPTVDFENINLIKKNAVTGLLRKRAKKYESESDSETDQEALGAGAKRSKKVVRKTMASAFKAIMSKKISEVDKEGVSTETPVASTETILAKYKKKARDLDELKATEEAEKKKQNLKEKQRLMGRRLPTKDESEKERNLAITATKGVVQLFNAVAEFQTSVDREIAKDEKEKKKVAAEKIQDVGKDKQRGMVSFNSMAMIEKIQSTQRKWKVLESDSEDLDGNIKVMDDEF